MDHTFYKQFVMNSELVSLAVYFSLSFKWKQWLSHVSVVFGVQWKSCSLSGLDPSFQLSNTTSFSSILQVICS